MRPAGNRDADRAGLRLDARGGSQSERYCEPRGSRKYRHGKPPRMVIGSRLAGCLAHSRVTLTRPSTSKCSLLPGPVPILKAGPGLEPVTAVHREREREFRRLYLGRRGAGRYADADTRGRRVISTASETEARSGAAATADRSARRASLWLSLSTPGPAPGCLKETRPGDIPGRVRVDKRPSQAQRDTVSATTSAAFSTRGVSMSSPSAFAFRFSFPSASAFPSGDSSR